MTQEPFDQISRYLRLLKAVSARYEGRITGGAVAADRDKGIAIYQPQDGILFITGGGWMLVTLLALERLRLRIGEDLSVICFDDMSEYELLDTPVSHIHMPLRKMGETAIDYLVRRCRGGSIPPLRETMDADLVINRSCRRFQPHL